MIEISETMHQMGGLEMMTLLQKRLAGLLLRQHYSMIYIGM